MKTKAAVFAGQGAQAVGMGKDLADADPACRALFDTASSVLGYDLARICFEGPIEELTKSNHCQPAIFTMSVACFRALERGVPGLTFAGTAGLSLGEWSALHAAGALSFEDAVRILEARGRFMQEACQAQEGGMISVMGLDRAALEKVCAEAGVEIANLNSPEQTVLSGPKARIPIAEKLAAEAGAKRTVVLNVAGAFHSTLMAPAAARLEQALAHVPIRAPAVPVISNVTGQPHGTPDEIRQAMVRQVTSPVQWVTTVGWFRAAGAGEYWEFGPGKVLSGLIKRIDKDAATGNIQDRPTLEKAAAALKAAGGNA